MNLYSPQCPMDLSNRAVLVTGSSSGLGLETAILLGRLNARVAVVGRSGGRLQSALSSLSGEGHVAFPFDLCQLDVIPGFANTVVARMGLLAGLVHSAGMHIVRPLRTLKVSDVEEIMRLNYSSALLLAKAFRIEGNRAPDASIVGSEQEFVVLQKAA